MAAVTVDLVAEEAACGVAAAVDLGLDRFDDDALTAFCRFHLVRLPDGLNLRMRLEFDSQIGESLHLTESHFSADDESKDPRIRGARYAVTRQAGTETERDGRSQDDREDSQEARHCMASGLRTML